MNTHVSTQFRRLIFICSLFFADARPTVCALANWLLRNKQSPFSEWTAYASRRHISASGRGSGYVMADVFVASSRMALFC